MTEHHVIVDGIQISHDPETHELVLLLHHAPEGALEDHVTECEHDEGQLFTTKRMRRSNADGSDTVTDISPIKLDLYELIDDLINNPHFDPSNN